MENKSCPQGEDRIHIALNLQADDMSDLIHLYVLYATFRRNDCLYSLQMLVREAEARRHVHKVP